MVERKKEHPLPPPHTRIPEGHIQRSELNNIVMFHVVRLQLLTIALKISVDLSAQIEFYTTKRPSPTTPSYSSCPFGLNEIIHLNTGCTIRSFILVPFISYHNPCFIL